MADKIIALLGPQVITKYPWVVGVFAAGVVVITVAISIQLVVGLWKSRTATDHSILWGAYKWSTSAPVRALEENINKLSRDSEIKGNALFLAKLFARDFADLIAAQFSDDELNITALEILAGLPDALRSNSKHRCAVLVREGDTLKILYGHGYSEEGTKHMRLSLTNSCAGEAYRTGEFYYCKDTSDDKRWSRLPNATHTYRSIVCIPIRAAGTTIGILNVDAVEPNAFKEDDIAHLQLFSAQCSILLQVRDLLYSQREVASS